MPFAGRYFLPVWVVAAISLAMISAVDAAMDMPVGDADIVGSDGVPESPHSRKRGSRPSGLDERVIVHTDSKKVSELIDFLAPPAWRVKYDVDAAGLSREVVFHAETTRKRALDELCSSLELKGIFYPKRRLILIVDGARR